MSGRVERLLHWCSENKIYINPIIQIYDSDSDGISVKSVSREEIPPDVLLVKIPKSCVLSVRNCSLAKEIKALDLEFHGTDASMGLALALSVEFFVQKNKSQWWPYLQSMPAYVDLPTLFWNQSEPAFQYLRQARLCRNEKETKLSNSIDDFYHEKLRPFFVMNCSSVPAPTSIQFREMYSLVSSRAFIVDAYHGLCMVPIADAFNHSHPNHVQLESDYIVCPECGRLSDCPHDTVSSQENSETEDDDLEMTTGLTVDPFEEVFNTYGTALKNADLLLLYGFVLEANENDVVTIDPEEVWEAFTNSNPLQKRFGSMDEVSHASRNLVMYICAHIEGGSESTLFRPDNPEARFSISSEGKPSVELVAVVICLIASSEDEMRQIAEVLCSSAEHKPGLTAQFSALMEALVSRRLRNLLPEGIDNCAQLLDFIDEHTKANSRLRLALQYIATEASILQASLHEWEDMDAS